ncbi:macro domain-containing protein [archaeon]|nr:macro domain-containing protein [archaeon]NCQ51329.1 macro domain-containing protein [archaeon]NCT58845.1 macro domain-containing protein [archaeon]
MKEIQGDLIELALNGKFDVIVHGCNCFCNMGAGIAKTIKEIFPDAYYRDLQTIKGDKTKLGTLNFSYESKIPLYIINAYTQYYYGISENGNVPVDYEAIRSCMKKLKSLFKNSHIGMPLIGCGLAGGKWEIVKKIIDEELKGMNVTIVHYKG